MSKDRVWEESQRRHWLPRDCNIHEWYTCLRYGDYGFGASHWGGRVVCCPHAGELVRTKVPMRLELLRGGQGRAVQCSQKRAQSLTMLDLAALDT